MHSSASGPPREMRLAVIGSGSLARATCLALDLPADVLVLARNRAAVVDLCHVARLRAVAAGRPTRFTPAGLDMDALARHDPAGVLVAASTQSPWEPLDRPSAWSDLLRAGGLAVALPFQAELALAVRRTVPDAWVVNACLPDLVNPLLALLGAPVQAGVGNIGMLATALQDALGLPDESRLRLVAHHYHLRAPADPADEARAWLDGEPVADVGRLLAAQRAADRRGMNDLTGALAARLLADLATGAARDTHLPGVAGRPGGYPVRVEAGAVALRGVDPAAEALNRAWTAREGVSFDAERVRFGSPVAEALLGVLPQYAGGFAAAEFADVLAALHEVRDELRA